MNLEKQIYENEWQLQYSKMNNCQTVSLKGGLSAQICFAKYVAFRKQITYVGYSSQVPKLSYDENFVQKTLSFVYKEIKSHKNNQFIRNALYSPGVFSVPYLIQTCNLMYLPSQFLIGVTSIQHLKKVLLKAKKAGYKCYAVVGHDPCLKNTLCAWIKFIQMPPEYISLIKQFRIKQVLIMSVFDPSGKQSHGSQRTTRLFYYINNQSYSLNNQVSKIQRKQPNVGDIYMLFIQESYGKGMEKDIQIFLKYVNDIRNDQWKQFSRSPVLNYICDWQSGIDCLQNIQASTKYLLNYQQVQFTYILSKSSWNLYKLAYFVGKKFVNKNYDEKVNNHQVKGLVFNQYFMCNPTYELGYGYVPILYWQFYPQNEERILKFITQEDRKLDFWFNLHNKNQLPFSQAKLKELSSQSGKKPFIIKTNNKCIEIADWVTKHIKKSYSYRKFLTIQELIQSIKPLKVCYRSKFLFQRFQ